MASSKAQSSKSSTLTCFAVTAPGIEAICARELEQLGVRPTIEDGVGVTWNGDSGLVAAANLWLRTASRVLVRIAEFRAKTFFELERSARKIDWERFVSPGGGVRFRVTCRKSKLYHSGAVAQRFAEAVAHRVSGAAAGAAPSEDDDSAAPGQLFVVRFLHDVCTVSVDSSGELLHRRGYRLAVAKAPLRETLAAAMLLGAGWTGEIPLVDPMCGSGTIPIEAARLARRMAPGRDRRFAFLEWPETNPGAWKARLEQAHESELPRSPVSISGADRDRGAIDAARANAERAGVTQDIDLRVEPISALSQDETRGLIVSNPPYGTRVGERDRLRNLYAQLGNVAKKNRPEWSLALLLSDRQLEAQVGVPFREVFETRNGGIPVRLVMAPRLSR